MLFAYRATVQASTGESPFFLLYGRDPQLPTELVLTPALTRDLVQLDDYKSRMMHAMGEAWDLAQRALKKAQARQKKQHDKHVRNADFRLGERVYVFMPALKSGPTRKLALPYKGPYRITEMMENGAKLQLIGHPQAQIIRVALNRLRRSPEPVKQLDTEAQHALMRDSGTGEKTSTLNSAADPEDEEEEEPIEGSKEEDLQAETPAVWKDRLRPRTTVARGRAS